MRRFTLLTLTALCCVAAPGEGLFDCIEPDVLRALLLQSQGERLPVITAAVPMEIAALKMPREFAWIGSSERITGRVDATTNASQVTAAWRTSLAPDAARAATATALTGSGWEVRSQPGMSMNVFMAAAMQTSAPACRDGKPLNFTASAIDGTTYVLFTIQRGDNGNSICSQPARSGMSFTTGLEKYMPRLEMPVDPATGVAALIRGSGAGGGSGGVSARAEFAVQDSLGNVARYFAKQMAEQGWSSDANWSGISTAGSVWSRRDAGTLVQSRLSVTAVDDHQFVAFLHILKLP